MAILAFPYSVRDTSNTTTDNRKTGLTATVSNGHTLAASPASVTASGNVTVVEVGSGDYIALYDPEANGDASFPVDWGSALSNPNDRYGTLILTRDAGRVLGSLGASGIAPANLTPDSQALLFRGYFATTATTTPATADAEWAIAGTYTTTAGTSPGKAVPYYRARTLGSYAWTDGSLWYITSTAPGVTLPAAYFATSAGGTVLGPYTGVGSTTGTPVVSYDANSILSGLQPNTIAVNASQFGGQTLTVAAPVTVLANLGTAAVNTAQSGDSYARLGVAGAGLTALGDARLAHLTGDVATGAALATLTTTIGTPATASIAGDIATRAASGFTPVVGTVLSSPAPTTTAFSASGSLAAAYTPAVQLVQWLTGANAGQRQAISAYTKSGSTGSFTIATAVAAPVAGDTFEVI